MSKVGWSEPDKFGRRRYQLAKGFQIIERSVVGGKSYDFIYREEVVKDGRIVRDRRPRVMQAKNRDDAVKEGFRLVVEVNERKNAEPAEPITLTNGSGCPTVAKIAEDFLRDKKSDGSDNHKVVEAIVNNRLVPEFGRLEMSQLRLQHQKKYRDKRRNEGIADVTIRGHLNYLGAIYTFAIDHGYYDGANPINIAKLKLNITERERLMEQDEEALIWAILPKYKPMNDLADFLYGTCMRPGNMVYDLTWDRIHWEAKEPYAFIPKAVHKNRKADGKYFLTKKVLKLLRHREKENVWNFPYVFWRLDEEGKPIQIAERWIQRQWEEVMKEAGIKKREKEEGLEPLRFYDLKHTRLSRLGARGASVFELKRISNHKSTASLERYVKNEALNGAALRLLEEDDAENGVLKRSNSKLPLKDGL